MRLRYAFNLKVSSKCSEYVYSRQWVLFMIIILLSAIYTAAISYFFGVTSVPYIRREHSETEELVNLGFVMG